MKPSLEVLDARCVPAALTWSGTNVINHAGIHGTVSAGNHGPTPPVTAFQDADGLVHITGTSRHDKIDVVDNEDGTISVEFATARRPGLLDDAELAVLGSFEGVTGVVVKLGSGDDQYTCEVEGLDNVVRGGAGRDSIQGSLGGRNWLYGEVGNDVLIGNEGDVLNGGGGRDRIYTFDPDPVAVGAVDPILSFVG